VEQQQQQRCIFSLLLTAKVFCLFSSVVVSLPPAFFNAYYNSAVCILHPKVPVLYNEQAGVMMMLPLPLLMLVTK
jgi:hypothetical protein